MGPVTATIDAEEYEQLRFIRGKGGVAVGGDAFHGCYDGVIDSVAGRLEKKGLLKYQGFSEHWQWAMEPEASEAIAAYEEAQIRARQVTMPWGGEPR